MADTKPTLKDGTLTWDGGADASRSPSDIAANQYTVGVNCDARGGTLKPRTALSRVPLTFGTNLASVFQRGFFTHADFYSGNGFPALMVVVSGRLLKIDLQTNAVSDITPQKILNTTLTADFTIPAVNGTVQLSVVDTSKMYSELTAIRVAGYTFTLVTVDSPTLLTVMNTVASQVGLTVSNPITTANFTIPALFASVNVSVNNTASLNALVGTTIQIGGNSLYLVSVNSGVQITVKNTQSTPATVVNSPAYIPAQQVTFNTYDINNQTDPVGWSLNAENYWIYQNNKSPAIIFNGSGSRRADPSKYEIPVGNVMAYVAGRISVALPNRTTYRVGDIVFGQSGTPANGYIDAILKFTENNYLNEGGDFVARIFGAPSDSGPIYSMKAAAMTDTQLGQGPMIVGTPNVVFTVNLPFDRTTWKNLTNALQTATRMPGALSQKSTVMVNSDLWYRSLYDIRSYILSRRDTDSWANTGQSAELGDLLAFDNEPWLESGSAALFNNRLLMTVSPQLSQNGVYHRGLVSLDFNLVSNIRGKSPPAWEGVWTGLQVLQVVPAIINNIEHLYVFALNANKHIELWEFDTEAKFDDLVNPISWAVESRGYTCGDSDRYKKLDSGRMAIKGLVGPMTWAVKLRTDENDCWTYWDNSADCAKYQDCGPYSCTGPTQYAPQVRSPINFRTPPDVFDPINNTKVRTGYEFQLRLELSGWFEIKSLRIYAFDEPEPFKRETVPSSR